MNIRMLVGIVLFVAGLGLAVWGIAGVGSDSATETMVTTRDNVSGIDNPNSGNMWVPVMAALSLASGGLLIGLSMGNWRRPRRHYEPGDEAVNPEGHHKMKHV